MEEISLHKNILVKIFPGFVFIPHPPLTHYKLLTTCFAAAMVPPVALPAEILGKSWVGFLILVLEPAARAVFYFLTSLNSKRVYNEPVR